LGKHITKIGRMEEKKAVCFVLFFTTYYSSVPPFQFLIIIPVFQFSLGPMD